VVVLVVEIVSRTQENHGHNLLTMTESRLYLNMAAKDCSQKVEYYLCSAYTQPSVPVENSFI